MALQGLFGILLNNRAKLEQTVTAQLQTLLEPYKELLDSTVDSIQDPEALKRFCPTPDQLLILIATKDNIESTVIALQRRVTSLQTILQRVQVVVTVIPPIITLIKALPIPNQFTTAGFVLTLSDRLEKVKVLSQKYRGEIAAGTYVLAAINGTFSTILQLLQSLDRVIVICAPDLLVENQEIKTLTQSFNQPVTQFNNTYKEYKIEIRVVDRQAIAPQRFAVAIDRSGITVLEGRPSFSSSTQVLIDEIKFRIDQLII